MTTSPNPPAPSQGGPETPDALHARALDDLRYIRRTMEGAASFTALSGWGVFAIGVTAFPAAYLAAGAELHRVWMLVWLIEAIVGVAIGFGSTARKARRAQEPLFGRPGRKFALTFATPMAAGAILTVPLYYGGMAALLPGVWLLLYGTAFATAGAFSVSTVPVMGLCFMVAGTAALASPASLGNYFMAAGFGALHLVFGALIARKHGG
jgi:hypothetical protein